MDNGYLNSLSSRGITGINNEEYEIKAGDTVWVPREELHWFYNSFDEACEFLFIYPLLMIESGEVVFYSSDLESTPVACREEKNFVF